MGGILGQPFLDEGYDPLNPTKEAIKECKKKHKNLRNVAKSLCLCIAKDTLIRVRGKGLVPIQDITAEDYVWDGDYWVKTSGALHQGRKSVIDFNGISLTADHKILTENRGWCRAGDIRESDNLQVPKQSNASWADVWAMGSLIIRWCYRKIRERV
jgi:hypothetical protein